MRGPDRRSVVMTERLRLSRVIATPTPMSFHAGLAVFIEILLITVGLVALIVWSVRWIMSFLSTSKEIHEIDQDLKGRLRELLDVEREHRRIDQERTRARIQELTGELREYKSRVADMDKGLERAANVFEALEWAFGVSQQIADDKFRELGEEAIQIGVEIIVHRLEAERNLGAVGGKSVGPLGDTDVDASERLTDFVFKVMKFIRVTGLFHGHATIAANLPPRAMERAWTNPEKPLKELSKELLEELKTELHDQKMEQ